MTRGNGKWVKSDKGNLFLLIMFDYLDKFNNLSSDLKYSVSNPELLRVIEELEAEYNIELASLIMRVMVKDVSIEILPLTLFTEFNLSKEKSEKLAEQLENKVFSRASDYLGILPATDIYAVKTPETLKSISGVSRKSFVKDNNEKNNNKITESSPGKLITRTDVSKRAEAPASIVGVLDKGGSTDNKNNNDYLVSSKISPIAVEIFRSLNLKFKNNDKKDKFISLLDKYLRGIKDRFSVRRIFTENLDGGGFGLSDKTVDDIFIIAQEIENEEYSKAKKNLKVDDDILLKINKLSYGKFLVEDAPIRDVSKQALSIVPPIIPVVVEDVSVPVIIDKPSTPSPVNEISDKVRDRLEDIKREMDKIDKPAEKEIEVDKKTNQKAEEEILSDLPVAEFKVEIKKDFGFPGGSKKENVETIVDAKDKEITRPMPGRVFIKPDNSGKIKMTDIRKIRTTGPIDELKFMTLVDFRRISENPEERFSNISQKLKVLEDIDYGKKIEGIKAWRQSPVNKMYLSIFLKSSEEGVSVDKIIEKLKKSGQDYLTREEINALVEFNNSISF